jgi:hypothetical protein
VEWWESREYRKGGFESQNDDFIQIGKRKDKGRKVRV